jgi:hypothetical protein
MMRSRGRFFVVLAFCAALAAAVTSPARAGFVNGGERFDGTQHDTQTWTANFDLDAPGQTTAVQDDALTLHDDIFTNAVYATRKAFVRIGDSVRVDVTPLSDSGQTFGLRNAQADSGIDMQFFRDPNFPGGHSIGGGQTTAGGGSFGTLLKPGGSNFNDTFRPDIGQTLTWEISLLSDEEARYSIYDPATGTLLARTTQDLLVPLGNEHFDIELQTGNATARFDNVRYLPGHAVSLPPAVFAGGVLLAGMIGRRIVRRRV